MPNLVPNTTTNGVVSAGVIGQLIDAVNRIGDWLEEIGYQNPSRGPFAWTRWEGASTESKTSFRSIDDAVVTGCRLKGGKLTKGQTSHSTVTYTAPGGLKIMSLVAVPLTKQPAFVTIESIKDSAAILNVHTSANATSNEPNLLIHVLALCFETSPDTE